MLRLMKRAVLSMVVVTGLSHPLRAAADQHQHWVSSWGAALMAPGKHALPESESRDVTLRQIVRLSLGGTQLRLRVSNLLGTEPLVIGAATLASAAAPGNAALAPDLPVHGLRFGGAAGIVVPAGQERLSDPLPFAAVSGQDVALSLYFAALPARQTAHVAAHATQFIAPGDQSVRPTLERARALSSWFQLGGIEVWSAAPALVAAGDSITDGSGSGRDANQRWTDYLQRRIGQQGGPPLAVINSGIGGNQMLRDDIGQNLLDRFERDVLARPGVTHALVLIGVNDLGRLHTGQHETAQSRQQLIARLQAGWQQMADRAHDRGICFYAGTITPYGGSTLYHPEPHNEQDRRLVNDWLRRAPMFDGVADFDAAVRDPAAPDRLLPQFDSGDHLHLSPAGYQRMAGAVPLEQLRACRRAGVTNQPYNE